MKDSISPAHRDILQSTNLTALKISLAGQSEDDQWSKKEIAELSKKAMKLADAATKTGNLYEVKKQFEEIKSKIDALAQDEEKKTRKPVSRMKVIFHRIHPTPEKTLAHIDYLIRKAMSQFNKPYARLVKLADKLGTTPPIHGQDANEPPLHFVLRIKYFAANTPDSKWKREALTLADKLQKLAPIPNEAEKKVVQQLLTSSQLQDDPHLKSTFKAATEFLKKYPIVKE